MASSISFPLDMASLLDTELLLSLGPTFIACAGNMWLVVAAATLVMYRTSSPKSWPGGFGMYILDLRTLLDTLEYLKPVYLIAKVMSNLPPIPGLPMVPFYDPRRRRLVDDNTSSSHIPRCTQSQSSPPQCQQLSNKHLPSSSLPLGPTPSKSPILRCLLDFDRPIQGSLKQWRSTPGYIRSYTKSFVCKERVFKMVFGLRRKTNSLQGLGGEDAGRKRGRTRTQDVDMEKKKIRRVKSTSW